MSNLRVCLLRKLLDTALWAASAVISLTLTALAEVEVLGHPWVIATAPGASTTQAFVAFRNRGQVDRLTNISVGNATVMLTQSGDPALPVDERLPLAVPSGSVVRLAPDGSHVQIFRLPDALRTGQYVQMILEFEVFGPLKVQLHVEPLGTKSPLHGDLSGAEGIQP